MGRRSKPRGGTGIRRARKSKRQKRRGKSLYAPLTPWVCHPFKRPRTA